MTGYRCPRCAAVATGDPATLVCARCGYPGPPAWPQAPPSAPAAGWSQGPGPDDRTLGLLVHVLGIVTGFLGPLILWLVKRQDSPFVDRHARAALDYQFTVAMVAFVLWTLFFTVAITAFLPLFFLALFPMLFLAALGITVANVVFGVLGAMAANRGEEYRYPIAFRMFSRPA